MAKHRYGRKKAKKSGHRKNPRRVAAGRKSWRTKVRRYGSKKAAIAATFGKRGKSKRGKSKKGKHRSAVAGGKNPRRVAAGAAKVRRLVVAHRPRYLLMDFGPPRGVRGADRGAFGKRG